MVHRQLYSSLAVRINRIRLEFKVILSPCTVQAEAVLIESDWNLKELVKLMLLICLRINRIRLEFKVCTPEVPTKAMARY